MQTLTPLHAAVSTSLYLGNPMDPPDVIGVDLGDARPTQLPGRAKSQCEKLRLLVMLTT